MAHSDHQKDSRYFFLCSEKDKQTNNKKQPGTLTYLNKEIIEALECLKESLEQEKTPEIVDK